MTSILDTGGSLTGGSFTGGAPTGGLAASTVPLQILRVVPQRRRENAVITLDGEIDISSAAQIRAAVSECLRRPSPESLLIDLSAVTFCDCAGIEALEWAHSRARTGRMNFSLSGVDARLRRIFTLAHAYGLLDASRLVRIAN